MSKETEGKLTMDGQDGILLGNIEIAQMMSSSFNHLTRRATAAELVRRWNAHEDLVKALKKYGHHSTPEVCCEASLKEGGKCTCGFEAALAKAAPQAAVEER